MKIRLKVSKMSDFDVISIVVIGFSTGFGSAFGIEFAKVVFGHLKGLKLVRGKTKNELQTRKTP
jgi:hypothetical protein